MPPIPDDDDSNAYNLSEMVPSDSASSSIVAECIDLAPHTNLNLGPAQAEGSISPAEQPERQYNLVTPRLPTRHADARAGSGAHNGGHDNDNDNDDDNDC